jgi:hypothetical protein
MIQDNSSCADISSQCTQFWYKGFRKNGRNAKLVLVLAALSPAIKKRPNTAIVARSVNMYM